MCSLWGPGVIAALSTHREVVLVMNANTTLEMRVLHVKGRERVCVFRTKLMKAENGNVCNSLEVSSCFSCQKSYNQDHCWVVVHCAVEVVGSAGPPVPDRLLLPVPLDDPIVP